MGNPVEIKGTSLGDMLADLHEKSIEAQKELEANGGICLLCGDEPAEIDNQEAINNFHCKVCNEKTAKLLKEAFKMPGFTQIKI